MNGEIRDDSRKEFGYRQLLMRQLERISQAVSYLRSNGSDVNTYRVLENSIDMLESLLVAYYDSEYEKNKPSKGIRIVKGDVSNYEKVYDERLKHLNELIKLMARKNLLLEEEVYDEWF